MTVLNPPGFLQNAGATHTAEVMRNGLHIATAGRLNAGSFMVPRGGVSYELGTALQVVQTGTPGMSVDVRPGHALIAGTEGTKQGLYSVLNDALVTLPIDAAHASLARIDLVVFKVEDSAYSGVNNTSSLAIVKGTASGSPAAPAAPANSIVLAHVAVAATDTSITNGEITDKRIFVAGSGGAIRVQSGGTKPVGNEILEGQIIYNVGTRLYEWWDGFNWCPLPGQIIKFGQRTTNSTGTTTEIGVLRIDSISFVAGVSYEIFTNNVGVDSTVANDGVRINLRMDTAGGTATTSSTLYNISQTVQPNAAAGEYVSCGFLHNPGSNQTGSVLLSVSRSAGSGTVITTAGTSAPGPTELYIVSRGRGPGDSGVDV